MSSNLSSLDDEGKTCKDFQNNQHRTTNIIPILPDMFALVDEGVDNHEVSPHTTGPLSLTIETRLLCSLDRKKLTSSGKVQMTTLVTTCYRTLESDG